MELLNRLVEKWIGEARELRERYALESAARVCEAHIRELSHAIREAGDELLTVSEASDESGYSTQHLRALIASGEVPNAGRKGRPRIRRSDLPAKKKPSARKRRSGRQTRGQGKYRETFNARRLVRG